VLVVVEAVTLDCPTVFPDILLTQCLSRSFSTAHICQFFPPPAVPVSLIYSVAVLSIRLLPFSTSGAFLSDQRDFFVGFL